ncbi:ankyrin repeat domain-containing protein [Dongshaea marina]|uniref:ankyrin repeat domain-containing protein n=1 Tax=Dongshaea marina TaxID=2047966 RepID=UPI000D3EBA63|nr:ankyrin repeat domain-containing protein [Dongshaea marina]
MSQITEDELVRRCRSNKRLVSLRQLFFDPERQLDSGFWQELLRPHNEYHFYHSLRYYAHQEDQYGNTLMHLLALLGRLELLPVALELNFKLASRRNAFGQSFLHFALLHSQPMQPELWGLSGNSFFADQHGFTPFHIAAESGNLGFFKTYHHNCWRDQPNIYEATPLHWVMKNQEAEPELRATKLALARYLLSESPRGMVSQKNVIGMQPLDWASMTLSDREMEWVFCEMRTSSRSISI